MTKEPEPKKWDFTGTQVMKGEVDYTLRVYPISVAYETYV